MTNARFSWVRSATLLAASASLSGAAEAQSWTHVTCDYTWIVRDNGRRLETAVSSQYRFDTAAIQRWIPDSRRWYPECDAATGGFTEARCVIDETGISAVRRNVQGGETVGLDSFSINRMTAAFTAHFEFSYGTAGDASGTCRASDDPSAGLQRQF